MVSVICMWKRIGKWYGMNKNENNKRQNGNEFWPQNKWQSHFLFYFLSNVCFCIYIFYLFSATYTIVLFNFQPFSFYFRFYLFIVSSHFLIFTVKVIDVIYLLIFCEDILGLNIYEMTNWKITENVRINGNCIFFWKKK